MASQPVEQPAALSRFEQLRLARDILNQEGEALIGLANRLGVSFCRAIDLLIGVRGTVVVSGMGKAGLVGRKISATLSSTGTRSHFMHPAEALHGDLGMVHPADVVLVLSQSGETAEITAILPSLDQLQTPMIAITGGADSALAKAADVTIELGKLPEACHLGLAPSTSTTAMMAVGDALALVTSEMRNFRREDFARFHPAGKLGRNLSHVEDHMRPLVDCRVDSETESLRSVFVRARRPGRRSGAIMLIDQKNHLTGLFTDSDLARLFESVRLDALDRPIAESMTNRPKTALLGALMTDAVSQMASHKLSELPIVNDEQIPQGMLDITDIIGLFPEVNYADQEVHNTTGPEEIEKNTLPFNNPNLA